MSKKMRILMLEDMDTDAELIELELRRSPLHFSIERVETRDEFIRQLDIMAPDLILADYSLPQFDALSALQIVKEKCPDVPFVLVSGALGDELAVETLKSGATDYVLKNKLGRLVPAVQRALREAEERADRKRAEEEIKRLNEVLEKRVIERTLQLQATNEELEKAVRARETLLSAVSHDMRNLLMAINGSVKLLQRYNSGDAPGPQDRSVFDNGLWRIGVAASKMNALISELLDFARLQVGQPLDLYRRQTDLVALARQAAAEHQHDSESHRIKVETSEDTLVALWDAPRLERVLDNLVTNAIKYSPRGGEIVIRVTKESDEWAEFSVCDYGIGIPEGDLPYVFEWFRRAGNVPGRIGGTGIGLASARQVVEQHGGSITVESKEGAGSTFTVRLPLQQSLDIPILRDGTEAEHSGAGQR